jgi:hypothetical protein
MKPKDAKRRSQHARHFFKTRFTRRLSRNTDNKLCVLRLLITSRPVSFNTTFGTSRNGYVSIVTRLQAGRPRNHSSISGKGKRFPSPKRPYSLWSPRSFPLKRQLRFLLRGAKRPGRTANHSPPPVPGIIMSEAIPQLPHAPSWREQGQLHLNLNITGKNWDSLEKRLATKWTMAGFNSLQGLELSRRHVRTDSVAHLASYKIRTQGKWNGEWRRPAYSKEVRMSEQQDLPSLPHTSWCGIYLTFRRLMSYIYGAPILDVSRSHTTTQHSR